MDKDTGKRGDGTSISGIIDVPHHKDKVIRQRHKDKVIRLWWFIRIRRNKVGKENI